MASELTFSKVLQIVRQSKLMKKQNSATGPTEIHRKETEVSSTKNMANWGKVKVRTTYPAVRFPSSEQTVLGL